ncbi:hypothetical protein W97_07695 [Coniosporium apollinis CBS 100218]|uniref:Cyclic nucleotide-binding domain-containing protein n=1 Tax=Coniosporium apollinis (strain CBS 100218) TaxID=1168221 RepID=R7Z2R9_CONA1|nr:uncharacterized protein W97_07695 [Coniosporium apollinis CBS 100218]EON68485.1 hypothetical protein W97_07695 [Coniosporium apollinis CBS 100218]
MRRSHRTGGGPTTYASKSNAPPVPDPIALIRSYDSEANTTRPIRPSPLTASTIQGLPLDVFDRLRSFPLFVSAPDTFLAAIGTQLRPQVHQTNDYILTEGDDAKAMYWLVRGAVRVASRDGESTYAELKPGAFFGEIGILMDIPRTATVIANMRSLVVRLNKEDLAKVLPNFPDVERAIREEAKERLTILERKKKEMGHGGVQDPGNALLRNGKRTRQSLGGDVVMGEAGAIRDGEVVTTSKKRKSPSPGLAEAAASSALGSGAVNVRQLLKELPLFSSLPTEILHFLGLKAQPRTYPPFTDIIKQGSQGHDVFFIVRGEVEVVADPPPTKDGKRVSNPLDPKPGGPPLVKARLKPGQYFGEVTSLSLAPRRTATVRSVDSVECLLISNDVLEELWQKCSPDLRRQVEDTAKQRLEAAESSDVLMIDTGDSTPPISELVIADLGPRKARKKSVPTVTFSEIDYATPSPLSPLSPLEDSPNIEPADPDPFLNVDLDNVRSRSRRGSLAPPAPSAEAPPSPDQKVPKSPSPVNGQCISPSPLKPKHEATPPEPSLPIKRPRVFRRTTPGGTGVLPEAVLIRVFQHFDVYELMQLRLVSMHWAKLLTDSPDILHVLDLTKYNRRVTDTTLNEIICPFVGNRPRIVDISNCFHVTDEGFTALALQCGAHVTSWKMKSVWDITGPAVLEMANRAKGLEEVDFSNCRKVGDNLLARVVGWVVPDIPPATHHHQQQHPPNGRTRHGGKNHNQPPQPPLPAGTVIGCPRLKRLTLSYCKHITDRSMAHIAAHAAGRIESIDLTRCTTITDHGFQQWSIYAFPRLSKLCLADCTYLTDNAIVHLSNAAKGLRELDLSFCCALSDTATEVLSLGCPNLTHLNLAFCGSAVSDSSLRSIGLHLLELKELSVRGCVRVTGTGVEAVVDGCHQLELFDVSQCKNLRGWLEGGGIKRKGKGVRFEVVKGGRGRW